MSTDRHVRAARLPLKSGVPMIFPGLLFPGHRMHIGRRESAPADGPVTTFELVDTNPGQREHVLAFYLDHRSRDFLDKLLFLIRGKNVPDDVDRHE